MLHVQRHWRFMYKRWVARTFKLCQPITSIKFIKRKVFVVLVQRVHSTDVAYPSNATFYCEFNNNFFLKLFFQNFAKCWPIFKFLSLSDSAEMFNEIIVNYFSTSQHTRAILLLTVWCLVDEKRVITLFLRQRLECTRWVYTSYTPAEVGSARHSKVTVGGVA